MARKVAVFFLQAAETELQHMIFIIKWIDCLSFSFKNKYFEVPI